MALGRRIDVELFVAWDATHAGGAITSVGSRPRRIVNFYQTTNPLWFQNGGRIAGAHLQYDLSGCFSHNAIARSAFVHDTTFNEISGAIARIGTASGGSGGGSGGSVDDSGHTRIR